MPTPARLAVVPFLAMTDAVQLALIAAVAPTLVAGVGVVVSLVNTLKANNIIGSTKEIHTLTNANLTKVTSALDLALKEIQGLREQINLLTKAKEVADALAEKNKPGEVVVVNKLDEPVPMHPVDVTAPLKSVETKPAPKKEKTK